MNRQSFGERICDDLSQVILHYLSLKDKLRLQCVSKQFQRTIFVKQTKIDSNEEDLRFGGSVSIQIKLFEILVKKCRNINKIDLNVFSYKFAEKDYNKTIDIIIKNCKNLTHLDINFNLISETNQKRIKEKFGSKLILTLTERSEYLYKCIFDELKVEHIVISSPFDGLPRLKFARLDRIHLSELIAQDLVELEVFIERNNHLIKYLDIDCFQINDNIISKFNHLVHLDIEYLRIDLTDNQWTQIALNCLQLKRIVCCLSIVPNNVPINDSLMSSLRKIKSLKRLIIYFEDLYQVFDETIIREYIETLSFKAFKGFKGLTHLSIRWPFSDDRVISETILTDIDINLPNLQFLILRSNEIQATEWTAYILCRLEKLQTLQIRVEESVQPFIKSLLQRRNKIKTLELHAQMCKIRFV